MNQSDAEQTIIFIISKISHLNEYLMFFVNEYYIGDIRKIFPELNEIKII